MHYLVYQTTNTVNGKIYVGVHQTEELKRSFGSTTNRSTCAAIMMT